MNIFGLVDVDLNDFFVLNTDTRTRGHPFKLFKKRSTGIRASFFCEKVVNVSKSLPVTVKFSSLASSLFKRSEY